MAEKENRGGKRDGAGSKPKPPKQYSDTLKKKILSAIKKQERESGKKAEEVFAEMMFSTTVQASVRQAIFKQYFDLFVPKHIEMDVNIPKICLPPIDTPPDREK